MKGKKKEIERKGKENTNYYKEILLIFLSWSFILKADDFLTNSSIFLLISLGFPCSWSMLPQMTVLSVHLNPYTSYPLPYLIASACNTIFKKNCADSMSRVSLF